MKRSLAFVATGVLAVCAAVPAAAETIVAVTTANALVSFDSATPGTVSPAIPITGLQALETIEAIDFRPSTGQLYALGIQLTGATTPIPVTPLPPPNVRQGAAGNTGRLYVINTATGVASLVGAGPFSTSLVGNAFGFDFDPVADVVRLVSNGEDNLRIDPSTGVATADTALSPDADIAGAAYDNNVPGGGATTLYDLNWFTGQLAIQGGVGGAPSPNGGVLTFIGPLGVTTTSAVGFDISGATGTAYASLTAAGGPSSLYTINLGTGAATLVGSIGAGLAIADISCPPPSPTPTPTNTFTATLTSTVPPTFTPTNTPSDTPTATPTVPSATPTDTPTATPTVPFSPTVTFTPTTTLAPATVTQTGTPSPGPPAPVPALGGPWLALLVVALGALGYALVQRSGTGV